ncbi:MAG: AhpC/TSA family protein [Odoribacteraceae bacterium]|nr:AhpC/TSA family protein [Odoribacteraceae bacterium]
MKKLFVSLLLIAAASPAFCAGDGFTITGKGKVAQVNSANVYLVVSANGRRDTIASAPVADGAFVLTGTVESLQKASIFFEGLDGQISLYLENAEYTIDGDYVVSGGGETQQVASLFLAAQQKVAEKVRELNAEFVTARDNNDTARMIALQGEYTEYISSMVEERKILAEHPNSLASVDNLTSAAASMDYDALKECFNLLGDEAKNTREGKAIAERLTKLENVSIGQIAPDFELDAPDGTKITLHGVKAKVKLIDFWASWCGPCRGENPNVVAMYNEYHPKGLEIVGVSLDRDKEAWLKAIADDGLAWVHGSDLKFWQAAPAQLYAVNAIPHTVLLDENNRIIAKNLRGAALKAKIAELLD